LDTPSKLALWLFLLRQVDGLGVFHRREVGKVLVTLVRPPPPLPSQQKYAFLDSLYPPTSPTRPDDCAERSVSTVGDVLLTLCPPMRRNDIRITGCRSSGVSSEEFDITITSLASQATLDASLPSSSTEDASAFATATELVHKHLHTLAEAKLRHQPVPTAMSIFSHLKTIPFTPLVFSLGGMMEKGTRDALEGSKPVMTGGVYSVLIRRLTLTVFRARVRNLE